MPAVSRVSFIFYTKNGSHHARQNDAIRHPPLCPGDFAPNVPRQRRRRCHPPHRDVQTAAHHPESESATAQQPAAPTSTGTGALLLCLLLLPLGRRRDPTRRRGPPLPNLLPRILHHPVADAGFAPGGDGRRRSGRRRGQQQQQRQQWERREQHIRPLVVRGRSGQLPGPRLEGSRSRGIGTGHPRRVSNSRRAGRGFF